MQVYITLDRDVTVPAGAVMELRQGVYLWISVPVSLFNYGHVINHISSFNLNAGTLSNYGKFENYSGISCGVLDNRGHFINQPPGVINIDQTSGSLDNYGKFENYGSVYAGSRTVNKGAGWTGKNPY